MEQKLNHDIDNGANAGNDNGLQKAKDLAGVGGKKSPIERYNQKFSSPILGNSDIEKYKGALKDNGDYNDIVKAKGNSPYVRYDDEKKGYVPLSEDQASQYASKSLADYDDDYYNSQKDEAFSLAGINGKKDYMNTPYDPNGSDVPPYLTVKLKDGRVSNYELQEGETLNDAIDALRDQMGDEIDDVYDNVTNNGASSIWPKDEYVPSSTRGDYSPSNPWDAPGMSKKDFL